MAWTLSICQARRVTSRWSASYSSATPTWTPPPRRETPPCTFRVWRANRQSSSFLSSSVPMWTADPKMDSLHFTCEWTSYRKKRQPFVKTIEGLRGFFQKLFISVIGVFCIKFQRSFYFREMNTFLSKIVQKSLNFSPLILIKI